MILHGQKIIIPYACLCLPRHLPPTCINMYVLSLESLFSVCWRLLSCSSDSEVRVVTRAALQYSAAVPVRLSSALLLNHILLLQSHDPVGFYRDSDIQSEADGV